MSCNCKNSAQAQEINDSRTTGMKITHYTLKTLAFLLMVVLLPIINLFLIYFMFKTLVLSKEVDIKPLLLAIGKKFKEKDDEDDEDDEIDYETLTPDDVVMLDVEDITNKSFK
jgi:hypothetical protein